MVDIVPYRYQKYNPVTYGGDEGLDDQGLGDQGLGGQGLGDQGGIIFRWIPNLHKCQMSVRVSSECLPCA